MEAIKKKIASLKKEMDAANENVDLNDQKAKQENMRADKIYDEVRDLEKKLVTLERDYEVIKTNFENQSAALEKCEKAYAKVNIAGFYHFFLSFFIKCYIANIWHGCVFQAESDLTAQTKRVQDIDLTLFKHEEFRLNAQIKSGRATELGDDARR